MKRILLDLTGQGNGEVEEEVENRRFDREFFQMEELFEKDHRSRSSV